VRGLIVIYNTIYDTMRTQDFLQRVKKNIDPGQFDLCRQYLVQVPDQHKERYLVTLQYCDDIFMACNILYKGRKLPDDNYFRFLKFVHPRLRSA
jgi:hypothetical protein